MSMWDTVNPDAYSGAEVTRGPCEGIMCPTQSGMLVVDILGTLVAVCLVAVVVYWLHYKSEKAGLS